jgi:hypothetical protein
LTMITLTHCSRSRIWHWISLSRLWWVPRSERAKTKRQGLNPTSEAKALRVHMIATEKVLMLWPLLISSGPLVATLTTRSVRKIRLYQSTTCPFHLRKR